VRGGQRIGFEIKRTTAPTVTPSLRINMKDLQLEKLIVVQAGEQKFHMDDRIEAVPIVQLGCLKS